MLRFESVVIIRCKSRRKLVKSIIKRRMGFFEKIGRYENALITPTMEFISSNFPEAFKKIATDEGANIRNHTIFFPDFFRDN